MEALKLTTPVRKPRLARKPVSKSLPTNDHLFRYANAGVVIMAALSAALNGYANSLHASIPWAGWGMGIIIPIIILILGKVAGLLYKRGKLKMAKATAGVGIGLLALSVYHCSQSIAILTGSDWRLAVPMAIAIDCGFVCCEIAALAD